MKCCREYEQVHEDLVTENIERNSSEKITFTMEMKSNIQIFQAMTMSLSMEKIESFKLQLVIATSNKINF